MFLINIAIITRALLSIIKRLTVKFLQPIIDATIILLSMYSLQELWAKNYFLNENYYNDFFLQYAIPGYVFFWLYGIYINQGYKRPYNLYTIPKGIVFSTIIMLIVYALLPEKLRFSRALIILGSIWSIISLLTLRFLLSLSGSSLFKILKSKYKRIGIIADDSEFQRIQKIIKHSRNASRIVST